MKTYIQPTTTVVRIQHQGLLMQSIVTQTSGNADINYGGGSNGFARTKESTSIWDEEW